MVVSPTIARTPVEAVESLIASAFAIADAELNVVDTESSALTDARIPVPLRERLAIAASLTKVSLS
jgi:hypothetical protein